MAGSAKSPPSRILLDRAQAVLEQRVRRGDCVCAALSGGVDSVVLLDVLQRVARKVRFKLTAIHVNHQLSPNAGRWQAFCAALCRARRIPFSAARVEVPRGDSIEKAARLKRYAVFAAQPAHFVALAHHLDDQAETVLLQLLRGAGVKGLSAMPVLRRIEDRGSRIEGKDFRIEDRGSRIEGRRKGGVNPQSSILNPLLLRPLLEVTRDEILAYARSRKLKWIEDESNLDGHYDRNYLRHEVLPLLAERFPAYRTTIARASRHFADAARLLDELAETDADVHGDMLEVATLRRLPEARARNVVRRYLDLHGVAMPNFMRLDELVRQIRTAKTGARITAELVGCRLLQSSGRLQLIAKADLPPSHYAGEWHGEAKLALPELGGTLLAKSRRGSGVSRARLGEATVTLRLRRGGERLQLDPKRPHRTLKNLFQEGKVPHWARQGLPLVYCDDELVCVPGIGVDWRYAAARGEPAIEFVWETRRAA